MAASEPTVWIGRVISLFGESRDRRPRAVRRGRGGQCSRQHAFPPGGAGLVSTIDDYLALGQMMLDKGRLGRSRILSRPSVETMTSDQLTSEQKGLSSLAP